VYYRYLYFLEDGRVLYALTSSPPHEIFPRFRKVCLQGYKKSSNSTKISNKRSSSSSSHNNNNSNDNNNADIDSVIVWGKYTVQKYKVLVTAKQPWQYVKFELTICPEYNMYGRFGYLSFDKHMTSYSNDGIWENSTDDDYISYEVPNEPFRFVRDRRL
jgi:F-box protein 9